MSGITVIIITKNEAENIAACLESVAWADEVIVVDHFSDDDTAAIATAMGAKVFREPWTCFSTQKNSALDKATRPWVLSLDADERVPAALRDEILATTASATARDGYFIGRRNHFRGRWIRHGGWYPDRSLRLFRRGRGRFEDRVVHECVKLDGSAGTLENDMEHYTYRSVSDYLRRLDRYSQLASLEVSPRRRWTRWHTLALRPLYTALRMLFLQRGFLDGCTGMFLAFSYSYYTFLKYYHYYERQKETDALSCLPPILGESLPEA
ncbi:MAG: glycosyltransferase family 2 protein [Deltaproteobacteria bacterium]|nr:glycosyltransferase family 2 protein [Candidatus Anaeroferrophillacea bacterium]